MPHNAKQLERKAEAKERERQKLGYDSSDRFIESRAPKPAAASAAGDPRVRAHVCTGKTHISWRCPGEQCPMINVPVAECIQNVLRPAGCNKGCRGWDHSKRYKGAFAHCLGKKQHLSAQSKKPAFNPAGARPLRPADAPPPVVQMRGEAQGLRAAQAYYVRERARLEQEHGEEDEEEDEDSSGADEEEAPDDESWVGPEDCNDRSPPRTATYAPPSGCDSSQDAGSGSPSVQPVLRGTAAGRGRGSGALRADAGPPTEPCPAAPSAASASPPSSVASQPPPQGVGAPESSAPVTRGRGRGRGRGCPVVSVVDEWETAVSTRSTQSSKAAPQAAAEVPVPGGQAFIYRGKLYRPNLTDEECRLVLSQSTSRLCPAPEADVPGEQDGPVDTSRYTLLLRRASAQPPPERPCDRAAATLAPGRPAAEQCEGGWSRSSLKKYPSEATDWLQCTGILPVEESDALDFVALLHLDGVHSLNDLVDLTNDPDCFRELVPGVGFRMRIKRALE